LNNKPKNHPPHYTIHYFFAHLHQNPNYISYICPFKINIKQKTRMKNLHRIIWILAIAALFNVSCQRDESASLRGRAPLVSQFIYQGLTLYYLWDDQTVGREPTAADTNPWEYFERLLHPTDRWSRLTDDVDGLLGMFAGEATDAFGFVPTIGLRDGEIVGVVRYVYPNTPADAAGIKRGDFIVAANGSPFTPSNFHILFGANSTTTFGVRDQHFENPQNVVITPCSFSTSPILYTEIHEIGGRIIGYIFYTGFRSNANDELHEVFSRFRQRGVTDLILDLRYNPGGSLSAAAYLASLIVPREHVVNRSVLTVINYNEMLNELFSVESRKTRLGVDVDSDFLNPLDANLNLPTVHIIATGSSASASELIIFCLHPFMNVVHIGEETVGKCTVSITVHAFNNFGGGVATVFEQRLMNTAQRNELRDWAMQPIVGRYTDKNGESFTAEGTLTPNHAIESQENYPHLWLPIGDLNDYLISKAISLITGQAHTPATTKSASGRPISRTAFLSPQETLLRRAVNVDNLQIEPEVLQKLLRPLCAE
jgi:C-terminal processing protease CtpA/Prc